MKKGDIVARKSYGKDILFTISRIVKLRNEDSYAILKGVTARIEADAPLCDLEQIDKSVVEYNLNKLESRFINKIIICSKETDSINKVIEERTSKVIYTGKILHLDGDKKYSDKSMKFYKQLKLNAVVKNISERNQPKVILQLLERYKPDILVITGHDGMIKNGARYNDLYNYRNSGYFMEAVKEAKKWEKKNKEISIFAGACQSFYEILINAGANFASSPERILIDFIDPLIIAQKIATTDKNKFISIKEMAPELRDGTRGVGGVGTMGKMKVIIRK